jgi:PAS domain S-box-containing protein
MYWRERQSAAPEGVEPSDDTDNVTRSESDYTDPSFAGQAGGEGIVRARNIARIITSILDIDQAYEEFANTVRSLVPFDRIAVHVLDLDAGADAIKYVSDQAVHGIRNGDCRPLEGTETQHVMMTGQVLIRKDIARDPRFCRDQEYLELGLRSNIVARLETQGQLVGTLNLSSRRADAYGEQEQALLERLGGEIASAISNAQGYERTREEREQAVTALDGLKAGHHRLEARLFVAEEELGKFSHALAACPNSVMITDRETVIQYVNPGFTRLTGYNPEEVLGKLVAVLGPAGSPDEGYRQLRSAIDSGKEWQGECRIHAKSGEWGWSSRNISPVKNRQGLITLFVVADEDISEKKALEELLLQAQEMESIGYLVSGIAHDFNNLLLAMLGFTALLEAHMEQSSESSEYLRMIESLAHKASDLAYRLLSTAKATPVEAKPVDLNVATLEVLQLLRPTLSKGIEIDLEFQEDLPLVKADLGQLQQVIMNLCLNAAGAMPFGGRLCLSTRFVYLDEEFSRNQLSVQPGRYVLLSVEDTGSGISEEDKAKIFQPFFTTKGAEGGTGLGLSVAAGVVRGHGGTIQVVSTPGLGSTFSVYLPVSGGRQTEETDAR